MKTPIGLIAIFATSMLLAACGGGSSGTGTPAAKVTISSVTTDQLVYRKTTNMTITGENLDKGFNLSNPACLTISEVAGSTSTKKVLSCKIVGTGTIPVSITAAEGSSLYSGSITIPLSAQPQVTMLTSLGTIVLELDPAKAPVTVDNFLNYVESGFYVNKIFHRVISNFVIQGGGFTSSLQQPATMAPIKLEAGNGLSNLRGTIAMARTNAPNSATSQFFINVEPNLSLDKSASTDGYAVFGKVVTGLDIVDKIKVVPTASLGGMPDVPVTPILITSMLQTK